MGLFGGFKAKFTGSSSNKNKTQQVVCLKYHIHSEFDGPESAKSLQVNSIKNEAPRTQPRRKDRKALTKSAFFPETSTSTLSSSTPQKSLSLTNLANETSAPHHKQNGHVGLTDPITVSTTFNFPSNGTSVAVSDTEYRKTTEEHNGVVTEKVAVVANNHLYSTDHNVKNEQHAESILKKVSSYDEDRTLTNGVEYTSSDVSYLKPTSPYDTPVKENGLHDQSTLIFMTQHSSRSSSFDKDVAPDQINFTKSVPLNSNKLQENYNDKTTEQNSNTNFASSNGFDEEVDYFKINVVKYDLNRSYSQSEDEQSHHEEEEPSFTRMGYSSQAASIFFGEGEETEVARPRRIQLIEEDDDERRSSGADC